MKRITLLLATIGLFFLFSCEEKDKNSDFFLEFEKYEITFNATQGTAETIEVISSSIWHLNSELPDWLFISNPVGDESPLSITFTVEPYTEMDSRDVTLQFSNNDNVEKSVKIIQRGIADSDPFIELEKELALFTFYGETEQIKLTTNCAWEITTMPTWIHMTPSSGDGSVEITIQVDESALIEGREAVLDFRTNDDNIKTSLIIKQSGRDNLWQGPFLSIFSFPHVRIQQGHYTLTTDNLFVNKHIREKIHLGNLIDNQVVDYPNFAALTGYTFNPITVSTDKTGENVTVKTFTPSFQEQELIAKEITARPPQEKAFEKHDNFKPTSYNTHRTLYTIGWGNMAIALDEIVSGISFKEQEMTRKYGMIFSFKHTLFGLDIDWNEQLIKEKLKAEDQAKKVTYVSRMEYGKVGLLIVESDTKFEQIKEVIVRAIKGGCNPLPGDDELIDSADIAYVYFNNQSEVQVNKNNREAIKAYKAAFYSPEDKENIYPIGFSLSGFDDHTLQNITFGFEAKR